MDESAVFLENFDKATHVSPFELVGEVDGEGDGGDGILGGVSTIADDDRVAESFDADFIDPEVAGIGRGLGVWQGIRMGRGRFQRMVILPQFRVQGKGGGGGEDAVILPRGYQRSHAKVANPTTLLTRFAEELRRAPGAGPDAGRGADAERKGRWVIGYWGLGGDMNWGSSKV